VLTNVMLKKDVFSPVHVRTSFVLAAAAADRITDGNIAATSDNWAAASLQWRHYRLMPVYWCVRTRLS